MLSRKTVSEAERTGRAKLIHAEGELQASEMLLEAARKLSQQSQVLQLRYLQTLTDITGGRTNTIVFTVPMDLVEHLLNRDKTG
jgi:regulator of protease activity HflC (stomatin/prohibitin superfamily)